MEVCQPDGSPLTDQIGGQERRARLLVRSMSSRRLRVAALGYAKKFPKALTADPTTLKQRDLDLADQVNREMVRQHLLAGADGWLDHDTGQEAEFGPEFCRVISEIGQPDGNDWLVSQVLDFANNGDNYLDPDLDEEPGKLSSE